MTGVARQIKPVDGRGFAENPILPRWSYSFSHRGILNPFLLS